MPDQRYTFTVVQLDRSPFWQARIYLAGEGGSERWWSTRVRIGAGAREQRESKRMAERATEGHVARLQAEAADVATRAAGEVPAHQRHASLSEVAKRMLAAKEVDEARPRALDTLTYALDRFVRPFFGDDRDVGTIKRFDLESFKATLRRGDEARGWPALSPSSVNGALTAIRQVLKHAWKVDELLEAVPEVANIPVLKKSKGVALTEEQVADWTDATLIAPPAPVAPAAPAEAPPAPEVEQAGEKKRKGPQGTSDRELVEAQHLVLFIANTGLRRFEALHVRFSWVDWEAGTLAMDAGVMKGGRERDLLALNATALEVLRERQALHQQRRNKADDRVFRDSRRMTRQATRASEATGLGHLRLHDLRHTYGSQLSANGASVTEVMSALSHSTLQAAGIYQHAYPKRLHEVAGRTQLGRRPAAPETTEPAAASATGGPEVLRVTATGRRESPGENGSVSARPGAARSAPFSVVK